jgi:hypothetical protein
MSPVGTKLLTNVVRAGSRSNEPGGKLRHILNRLPLHLSGLSFLSVLNKNHGATETNERF